MTRLGVRRFGARFVAEERDFSLLKNVQTVSGDHSPSCSVGRMGSFLRYSRRGVNSTGHVHLLPGLRMRWSTTLLPLCGLNARTGTSLLYLLILECHKKKKRKEKKRKENFRSVPRAPRSKSEAKTIWVKCWTNYVNSVKKKTVGPDRIARKGIDYRLNRRDRDHAQTGSGVHTASCAIDKCIYVSSWESAAVDALFRFNSFLR